MVVGVSWFVEDETVKDGYSVSVGEENIKCD
jgi:hypothetical protein